MLPRIAVIRRLSRMAPLLCLTALVVVGCSPDHYAQTALRPISDFGRIGDDIQTTTLQVGRRRVHPGRGRPAVCHLPVPRQAGDPEPAQIHGNTTVEIIWTIIPALILAAIAVPTVRGIFQTNLLPPGNALEIRVIGHQWWWEFRYPTLNVTTANELHIPVGQTISLRMETADVVHSFWNPRFAGKRDVFPNRETRLWFKAEAGWRVSGAVRRVLRHPARKNGIPGPGAVAGGIPGLGRAHADAEGAAARASAPGESASRGQETGAGTAGAS